MSFPAVGQVDVTLERFVHLAAYFVISVVCVIKIVIKWEPASDRGGICRWSRRVWDWSLQFHVGKAVLNSLKNYQDVIVARPVDKGPAGLEMRCPRVEN